MPTVSRFRNAASHKRPHDTVKQKKGSASIDVDGGPQEPTPSRKLSATIRTAFNESQEVFVIIVLWVSGLSTLAPIAAEGVHRLMGSFT
jgi:hypothetical protein